MGVGPILWRRREITATVSNSDLQPVSRTVVVCKRGAEVDGTQTGVSTITVKSGHGIATGDKFMVNTTTSKFYTAGTVTATTIPLSSGTATVTDGDALVNLGNDTGTTVTGTPNFNATSVPIYSRASTTTALNPSTVTSSSTDGSYGYWSTERFVWELILSSGTPTAIVRDVELERIEDVIDMREVTAGPTVAATAGERVRMYMLNDNFVWQYKDTSSTRYKWLTLDGANVTMSFSLSPPA